MTTHPLSLNNPDNKGRLFLGEEVALGGVPLDSHDISYRIPKVPE